MAVTIANQNKTSVTNSQVELERTPGEVAVSIDRAEGSGNSGPSPNSALVTKQTRGGGGYPSLVTSYKPSSNKDYATDKQSSAKSTFPVWERQQKRGYHRIQSCLQYWQGNGYQVLWVMLSTANGGNAGNLAYHHQRLRQRIERKLGYQGVQHYQVRTAEGNGVLHAFWAWRAQDGFRQRSFYVKQAWLSRQWHDIHGAPIVWLARVRSGRVSRHELSRYCMAQYVSGQAGYQYMSWSWGRTFGFPLVACWRAFKELWYQFNGNRRLRGLYLLWGAFLARGNIPLGGGYGLSMAMVRSGYKGYGRDYFKDWRLSA